MSHQTLDKAPLGKKTEYVTTYAPSLLYPIPRKSNREKVPVPTPLPFQGVDIWNAFEISWLNLKGKPQIAMAEFHFPCSTPNIVESKSLKLYLNSFTQTKFESVEEVKSILKKDLSTAAGGNIDMTFFLPHEFSNFQMAEFPGTCLDDLDIQTDAYDLRPDFLKKGTQNVEESLYSNLLKSNCLVTGQPDWGSVLIHYSGPQIDKAGLLKYIISFRNTIEFAEPCIERIFMDILTRCHPKKLSVYGRFTRRGGLDINPFRSNYESKPLNNIRNSRQ